MIINPYENIVFADVLRIPSISHAHTRGTVPEGGDFYPASEPTKIQYLYDRGIRHFAISNYHPSHPTYPLIDHWPEMPSDAIGCPNAEYYQFTQSVGSTKVFPLHANCIGGQLTRDGMGVPWNVGFLEMLDTLILADGGGITINHPYYSGTPISTEIACNMLDLDDRVLGIEVWNGDANTEYEKDETPMWDEILLTGRRCWGFGVPDWGAYSGEQWQGRNILLVNEATENSCLLAYRNGHFYVALYGTGLTFTELSIDEFHVNVKTNNANTITIVVDGKKNTFNSNEVNYSFNGNPIYTRVEATDASGERIFSQPVLFRKPNNMDEEFMTILSS